MHVDAKHLNDSAFQSWHERWSAPPWSLVYYGRGAAAGCAASGPFSPPFLPEFLTGSNHSLPDDRTMAGREQHSASAQSVQHAAAAALAASCAGPAPQPPSTSETLQALAPLTSALSAAGLSHNPAATAASVTLGTAAAGVAVRWPQPTAWQVTGRFPGVPVRAAALSAMHPLRNIPCSRVLCCRLLKSAGGRVLSVAELPPWLAVAKAGSRRRQSVR